MRQAKISVIIPTYKPDKKLDQLLEMLEKQTYPVEHVLLVNTRMENWKKIKCEYSFSLQVEQITQQEFDHGKTRDWAARQMKGEYLLFMTQDAVPDDCFLVERLLQAIEQKENIKVAYARQLPAKDCKLLECYTREYNYPSESCIKSKKDLEKMGIKTYFCSNVCAMYERQTYLELGGFVKKTIFNEDMIFAGNLIEAGYEIAYEAQARVIHSHNYSALEQFHRNFDLAVSQVQYSQVFAGIRSEGEGIRMVKRTAKRLWSERKAWMVFPLVWQSGWKYLGYLMGKKYLILPKWLIRACSMNKGYWE